MQFYLSALIVCFLPSVLSTAIPIADPLPAAVESSGNATLYERDSVVAELIERGPQKKGKNDCQKPIAQNLCTSGAPYCCSGEGTARVCGPASSVSCDVMTICCINTNGVSIRR